MTDTFTASNGITIRERDDTTPVLEWKADGRYCTDGSRWYAVGEGIDSEAPGFTAVSPVAKALREFFQRERDEELGRWRWPENPDYVVQPDANDPRLVTVMRESVARIRKIRRNRDAVSSDFHERFGECAEAYFEAHPERKPWEDATYKDVWVWTTADNTQEALGWVAGDGTWDIITPKGDGIKAAELPVSALVEAGFEKFRGEVSGVKRIPEDAS